MPTAPRSKTWRCELSSPTDQQLEKLRACGHDTACVTHFAMLIHQRTMYLGRSKFPTRVNWSAEVLLVFRTPKRATGKTGLSAQLLPAAWLPAVFETEWPRVTRLWPALGAAEFFPPLERANASGQSSGGIVALLAPSAALQPPRITSENAPTFHRQTCGRILLTTEGQARILTRGTCR